MTTCKKPDRDAPRLVCGYPMPCPHHTLVLEERELPRAMPLLLWRAANPTIMIHYVIKPGVSVIEVRASALVEPGGRLVWSGQRAHPLDARIAELRESADELTREAHCALETHIFGDIQR